MQLVCCITCLFSDYSPAGHGLTGIRCHRGAKEQYRFKGAAVSFACPFSGTTVEFDSAIFSAGIITFGGSSFIRGIVNFNAARFDGATVSFAGGIFFNGIIDFQRVNSWRYPPQIDRLNDGSWPNGVLMPALEPENPRE
jgi:hypothetical protein